MQSILPGIDTILEEEPSLQWTIRLGLWGGVYVSFEAKPDRPLRQVFVGTFREAPD